jgi:hypothetical protein
MNDALIRERFHRMMLRRQHAHKGTVVLNELGLDHGRCRADIAVVNGRLVGYEIKSDSDSLKRLAEQARAYSAVFDRAFIVVGERHVESVQKLVPKWWGVILSSRGPRGAIHFQTLRKAAANTGIDPHLLTRLLWRDEAAEILRERGLPPKVLRQPRAILYQCVAAILNLQELRRTVREHLKRRRNWRYPGSPS